MKSPLNDVLEHADELRNSLRDLVQEIGAADWKVRELTEWLGVDKSTASRLMRGLRASDAAAGLRELPGAEALARVIDACAARGATPETASRAREALSATDQAVRLVPGGRGGLATALAAASDDHHHDDPAAWGRSAAGRARAERAARRAAFAAQRFLQGVTVDSAVYGLFIGPGSTPGLMHHASVHASLGIRRLRPGPPILVGGMLGVPDADTTPTRVTLAGQPLGPDARATLLEDFCHGVGDRLRVERDGRRYIMWLDREDPPLDQPMSFAYGVKTVDSIDRHTSDRLGWVCITYTQRRPARELVLEVLVHAGSLGGGPRLVVSMDTQRPGDVRLGPPADGREIMDQSSRFLPLGRGWTRRGSARGDAHLPMFQHAMHQLSWNADHFDRYRLEIDYPLAFVAMQVWIPLAEPRPATLTDTPPGTDPGSN